MENIKKIIKLIEMKIYEDIKKGRYKPSIKDYDILKKLELHIKEKESKESIKKEVQKELSDYTLNNNTLKELGLYLARKKYSNKKNSK